MHGFTSVQFSNPEFSSEGCAALIARKPAFKAGGTSLKNRKKNGTTAAAAAQDANPWANLGTGAAADANMINEDALMGD
mgnify:CR=1 FL=1